MVNKSIKAVWVAMRYIAVDCAGQHRIGSAFQYAVARRMWDVGTLQEGGWAAGLMLALRSVLALRPRNQQQFR
ncbi:hypothetical protein ADT28_02145 [Xylella fastidiosa]|nr:hypothetical protein B398_12435 [Xylella fastidiosa 32]KXB22768.1 hypothetical protein ADT28_02145 [Xylella fastidiosa]NRP68848.1 hypothetical protein [Xylella fastidiosa]OCA57023.1 hypothetical protein AA93_11740 [Xylella fastidiosa subsp. pauca 11399]